MNRPAHLLRATVALVALAAPGMLQASPMRPIAVQDSFRIGTAGVLCTAQVRPIDGKLKGMFDRGYGIVCRDAAAAVGSLYALRDATPDAAAWLREDRADGLQCGAARSTPFEGLGPVTLTECTSNVGVRYRTYALTRGRTAFIADGLAGYDSALRLGLATLVSDRPVTGKVEVATTAAGDPAAFARVQAGTLDPQAALNEAYGRNNAGSFAEAAEFFDTLAQRDLDSPAAGRTSEYLVNQGLQQSNLGNFPTASQLFAQAESKGAAQDPIVARLLRNYRAIDRLNQRQPDAALAALALPVPPAPGTFTDTKMTDGEIDAPLADQINRTNDALGKLGGVDGRLRPFERAAILDGQAQQLTGVAYRQQGKYAEALAALDQANRTVSAVRGGRVTSAAFMRSESFAEMARVEEAQGDQMSAERNFAEAGRILDLDYPGSAAGLAAKARLAAFLARRGQVERALPLYQQVVTESQRLPGSAATMRPLLTPYFGLLAPRVATDPKAAADMFAATQIMVRPGIAQTQAVFARELSGGGDEAAALFRHSLGLSREVTRSSAELSRLGAAAKPDASAIAAERERLTALERDQTALQSKLADFPRYRVLAPPALTLAELQKALRPGEAYYQLRVIDRDIYAMLITPDAAKAAKIDGGSSALEADVTHLRGTIAAIENGQTVTYPFDVARARKLYVELFEPFGTPLEGVSHLIFEPDGSMLQLPPNLLIMEQAGADTYAARTKTSGGDEYDYRGIAWLGRDRDVSTAVSPRAFVDIRAIAPSKGRLAYLGLGHNAPPPTGMMIRPAAVSTLGAEDCDWPLTVWQNPIKPTELRLASQVIGQSRSALLTDGAFSDTALKARDDLNQYRVLHFATHGLVTAPRPTCPARPALVTSFGDGRSDGLLSFREIYDLKLDADVVVLSACDTAGMATIEATREAGVTTGGNFALDGLVRAFVGAGARSVIASHWPIPDDFQATERLMRHLFAAKPSTPMAAALREGQRELMASAETSHPYYWSAFAIVGDGEQPILQK